MAEEPCGYDICIQLGSSKGEECKVKLKLRSPSQKSADPEGSLNEYREYVSALGEPCDVVIIDGKARKACVNFALDSPFLKNGGLLVLFEAGRGKEGWLGWPKLTGNDDYQPEVQHMLSLGGELVNGCGLDRWPGLTTRRTAGTIAYYYPLEACFLLR